MKDLEKLIVTQISQIFMAIHAVEKSPLKKWKDLNRKLDGFAEVFSGSTNKKHLLVVQLNSFSTHINLQAAMTSRSIFSIFNF